MNNGFFEKKTVLRVVSYIVVAALASVLTMALNGRILPDKLTQLEQLIDEKYIGESDRTELTDAAAAAMVKATGDKWSYYIPALEYQTHKEQKANAYVGIGITITQREDKTGFDIIRVTPGSAAEGAGVLAGDVLTHVEGQDVAGMGSDAIRELVRGNEGTQVTVAVLRGKQSHSFTITRQSISVTVAEGKLLTDDIGLVTIYNFNDNCQKETVAAIESLLEQGAEKLIFDVRNNPGGYKKELVDLLNYLLPEGPLFHSEDYASRQVVDTSDEKCLEIPMAVLVNGNSYSAAEFFAAALEEYDWAVVVGEKTTGKGHYQQTYLLNDGSAVNLSVGKYFTPNGVNLTETGGITPEILVEVEEEIAKDIYAGTRNWQDDPQIQAALQALQKS